MRNFRSLKVWQKSHELSVSVYKITTLFPREETYGLTSQLRRAVLSVPANIAEGCGCNGHREFARSLEIAVRSASETEYYLLLSRDLKYLNPTTYEQVNNQVTEAKRMLARLIQRLAADS